MQDTTYTLVHKLLIWNMNKYLRVYPIYLGARKICQDIFSIIGTTLVLPYIHIFFV